MIVTISDLKIEIGTPKFGNQYDVQIQEQLAKLTQLKRVMKTPVSKREEKIKTALDSIKSLVEMKKKNNESI